ncbi:MAG: hypothetical protein GY791_10380 [Alphaproteobacteria bacterium]|nr:hypothetical protein [Alphaproteobacteria bacterium]
MLQALRKKTASIFAKILFGLLVLSFGVWGIGDILRTGVQSDVVAEVGPMEINAASLAREFQLSVQRLQQQLGVQIDSRQAQQIGLVDQALDRLIAEALLDVKAKEMGVTISEDLIRRSIQLDPAFRNQFGQFDANVFLAVLRNNGLDEATYVEVLREDMARRQLVSSVAMLEEAPRLLFDRLYAYRNERRVADVLEVRAEDQIVATPTDSELRAYYDSRTDDYMAPEYREITAIVLEPEAVLDEIGVDEEALRDAYDSRRAEFETPEKRGIRQIVLREEDKAKQAESLLLEGRSLDAVATEIADGSPIELGEITKDQLPFTELGDAAFALGDGEISTPVQSPFGWHILQVTTIVPGAVIEFDEVREMLRESLARDQSVDVLADLANLLEDELGGGATLEEAAAGLNLDILRIPAVDGNGMDPDGKPVADIPGNSSFLSVAFESEPGLDSFLTETTEGYFLLRVDSIDGEAPRPFDSVMDAVKEAVIEERRREAAKEYASDLLNLAKGSWTLVDLGTEQDLRVATSRPVTRTEQDIGAGVSAAVTAELFKVGFGEPAMAASNDGYAIIELKEIIPAEPGDDEETVQRLQGQTTNAVKADILEQLDRAIRQDHEVTINRPVIESIL